MNKNLQYLQLLKTLARKKKKQQKNVHLGSNFQQCLIVMFIKM